MEKSELEKRIHELAYDVVNIVKEAKTPDSKGRITSETMMYNTVDKAVEKTVNDILYRKKLNDLV